MVSISIFDRGIVSCGSWRLKTWLILYFELIFGGPDRFILSMRFSFSIKGTDLLYNFCLTGFWCVLFLSVVIVQLLGLAPWKVIEDSSLNIMSVNEYFNLLLLVSWIQKFDLVFVVLSWNQFVDLFLVVCQLSFDVFFQYRVVPVLRRRDISTKFLSINVFMKCCICLFLI